MWGPRQLLFFPCVPETPKGWTSLLEPLTVGVKKLDLSSINESLKSSSLILPQMQHNLGDFCPGKVIGTISKDVAQDNAFHTDKWI